MAQQLIINVEDNSIVTSLLNVLKSIKGVSVLQRSPSKGTQSKLFVGRDKKELTFPHIPVGRTISPIVENMVIGTLPQDFDWDKEEEKMWEEMAR